MADMHPCNSCAIYFQSTGEQREHYKTDFHLYNTKRRVVGLDPIAEEVWEERLQQIQAMTEAGGVKKGSSHIKNKEQKTKPASASQSSAKSAVSLPILDETHCLFDGSKHATIQDNVEYMANRYSFFIPDIEYLTDLPGMISFLALKLTEGHQCLYCDKLFGSLQAVRGHMLDMNHCRIGTHTDDLLDDIEDFYTYPDSDVPQAQLLDNGSLQLASGAVAISREYSFIYNQKLRSREYPSTRPSVLDLRGKYLTILGGAKHLNVHVLPTYRLKRMAKTAMREAQGPRQARIRDELKRDRTQIMQHCRGQIVEMYSYGK